MSLSRKFIARLASLLVVVSIAPFFVVAQPQPQTRRTRQTPPPASAPTTQNAATTTTKATAATPAPATPQNNAALKTDEQKRQPEARVTGSITGRVLNESGEPMAYAGVFASSRVISSPGGGTSLAAGMDGRFRIDNLAPAAYTVSAFVAGYVNVPDPTIDRGTRRFYHIGDDVSITLTKGGVITGTVTDADGNPVVAASVRAMYVRDVEGRFIGSSFGFAGGEQETDDRGIYRIYSLHPGSYIVAVGGNRRVSNPFPNPYDADAPTFYPSSTRDGAVEIIVHTGQETSGIDIRYRAERGQTVSGTLAGIEDEQGGANVILTHAATGMLEATLFTMWRSNQGHVFTFEGIADGDYDILARRSLRDGEQIASEPRRISVRGASIGGLNLTLKPLGSIAGRLQFEPPTTPGGKGTPDMCGERRDAGSATPLPQEAIVVLRRDDRSLPKGQPRSSNFPILDTTPDARGEFVFRVQGGARYHLEIRPPGEAWYVRSIAFSPATAASKKETPEKEQGQGKKGGKGGKAAPVVAPRASQSSAERAGDALVLKTGERLTGIVVQVAHGAAALRGQIVGDEGARLPNPAQWRVYLVPATREQSDNALRFAEAPVTAAQGFAFSHLAPGRYLVLLRPVEQNRSNEPLRPVAWDEAERARLRREAEAANIVVELQPCQRIEGFTLRR